MEAGADKTNVKEATSGKGLKIDYTAKVNVNKKVEKIADTKKTKSQPAEKTPVKKEAKAQKDPKALKASNISTIRKKRALRPSQLK